MREEGFSEPREKAGKLIQQLRDRNFILCYRGADTYSFVHRTFLEYFCAKEIVNRFNKRGTEGGMVFEVLRDEIFGQHWHEETWHEVLRLICGLVDAKFAGELIEFLMGVEVDRSLFLSEEEWEKGKLKPEGLMNLLLAADCFSEVENQTALESLGNTLLVALQREVEQQEIELSWDVVNELLDRIARYFLDTLDWLKQRVQNDTDSYVRRAAFRAIAFNYKEQADTLEWLKQRVQNDTHFDVREAAVRAIAFNYKEQADTLDWLKQRVKNDTHSDVREAAVRAIADNYKEQADTLEWLKQRVKNDTHSDVREAAVRAIADNYKEQADTLDWLKQRGQNDVHSDVRQSAVWAIAFNYKEQADTLDWLKQRGQNDTHSDVRREAVRAIALNYKEHADTLDWLKQRVQNDTHSDVRRAAVREIADNDKEQSDILDWLKESLKNHPDKTVRQVAFATLSRIIEDDTNEQFFLLQCILSDSALRPEELQDKSTEEILEFLLEQNPEEAEPILREVAQNYPDEAVRNWAQGRLVDS
jgi:hypothetical protein